jgi:hypothetical protein
MDLGVTNKHLGLLKIFTIIITVQPKQVKIASRKATLSLTKYAIMPVADKDTNPASIIKLDGERILKNLFNSTS